MTHPITQQEMFYLNFTDSPLQQKPGPLQTVSHLQHPYHPVKSIPLINKEIPE
jgi:hypothetical protein